MKKINKYLFGAFAALFTAGLFSCVEQAPEYIPGEADQAGCKGIYFPTQEAAADHTVDPTMERVITITISRDSLKGAGITDPLPEIEVPLVSSDTTGVFVVPASVKFAAGQQEATFNVTFEKAKTAVKYPLNIAVTDAQYGSAYNSTSNYIDLSVFCVEWKYFLKEDGSEKALFTYVQDWWGETHQFYMKYYEVDGVRHCVTESLPAEVEHEDGTVETVYGIWGTGAEYEMEFVWYTKTNYISIPYQSMGFNNNGDIIHACSEDGFYEKYRGADYYTSNGYADALDWLVQKYPDEVSFYDGHGGFSLFMYFVCDQDTEKRGKGYSFGSSEMAIADGYVRVDYSIDVEAGETVDGVVPVEFTLGTDVDTVKYVIVEGELNASGLKRVVNNIAENKAENVVTFKAEEQTDTIIGIQAEKTGVYSIVALTIIKGEVKESASTSFTYVTLDDKDEYAAVVTVATEPTSAMYEHVGLNAINSFGYFVYGKDLTEVKVGVFKTADVQAKGAEALAASIKTALSDSIVNIINGTGYATLATGLDALTSYSVVVYATNGYNSTVVTAEYETDGLPNEPTGITGTYTYAQFWEGDDPGLALLINPNYENTYAINNWGGGIDMNFTWDKETNACHVNDQFTGYTHSTYGDVYVIELADYTGNTDEGVSYFDPETQTFHFFVIYYVSAGYFGKGEEVFTLSDAAGANGRRLAGSQLTKAQGGKNHTFKPERNPQTVAFKAVAVERPARSSRFSAPVKVDSMLKF